jgi:hypothetical protein
LPSRFDTKAIFEPSGDQDGFLSSEGTLRDSLAGELHDAMLRTDAPTARQLTTVERVFLTFFFMVTSEDILITIAYR